MAALFDAPATHQPHPISAFLASPRLAAAVFAGLGGALVIGALPDNGAAAHARGGHRVAVTAAAQTVTTTTSPPSSPTTTLDPAARKPLEQPPPAVLPPVPGRGRRPR